MGLFDSFRNTTSTGTNQESDPKTEALYNNMNDDTTTTTNNHHHASSSVVDLENGGNINNNNNNTSYRNDLLPVAMAVSIDPNTNTSTTSIVPTAPIEAETLETGSSSPIPMLPPNTTPTPSTPTTTSTNNFNPYNRPRPSFMKISKTTAQIVPYEEHSPEGPVLCINEADKSKAIGTARMVPGASNGRGLVFLSRSPTRISECPCCGHKNVRTATRTSPNLWTWIAVIVLLLVFWPLCWLPLCMNRCKHTGHYCPDCRAELGEIEPMQDCCASHR